MLVLVQIESIRREDLRVVKVIRDRAHAEVGTYSNDHEKVRNASKTITYPTSSPVSWAFIGIQIMMEVSLTASMSRLAEEFESQGILVRRLRPLFGGIDTQNYLMKEGSSVAELSGWGSHSRHAQPILSTKKWESLFEIGSSILQWVTFANVILMKPLLR